MVPTMFYAHFYLCSNIAQERPEIHSCFIQDVLGHCCENAVLYSDLIDYLLFLRSASSVGSLGRWGLGRVTIPLPRCIFRR